jgi:transcriptional regulator with XRE-family HTH domain
MGQSAERVMSRVRQLFEQSGLTLDDLGQRMGYSGPTARQSAWQFLTKTVDPRVSMLQKFAAAIGIPVAELFVEKKKGRAK